MLWAQIIYNVCLMTDCNLQPCDYFGTPEEFQSDYVGAL